MARQSIQAVAGRFLRKSGKLSRGRAETRDGTDPTPIPSPVTSLTDRGRMLETGQNAMRGVKSILIVAATTACSYLPAETPVETASSLPPSVTNTSTSGPSSECISPAVAVEAVDSGDVATDAISLSGQNFRCSEDVVVAAGSSHPATLVGAQLAAALDAPLLLSHPQLTAELFRLDPEDVHLVGAVETNTPSSSQVHHYDVDEAVETAGALLGTEQTVNPGSADASIVETTMAMEAGDRVVIPDETQTWTTSAQASERLISELARPTGTGPVWLVDAADPTTAVVSSVVADVVGASVVAVDPVDLFRHPQVGEAIAGYPDRAIRTVGFSADLDEWKLRTLAGGQELPGGGFELFSDYLNRRFVAFYGNPGSPSLGAMGQVSPQEALTMMREGGTLTGYLESGCIPSPCQGVVPPGLLDAYAQDGAHVVPTFNYIASVAKPGCGTSLFPAEEFQNGIDLAADAGGYVVLDLQPGSENFLSQAQFYEDALKLSHVGLAIDPEWRCGWPEQTEFDRTGTVTAAEINEVISWVADLVREEGLPQKLLVIQQFRQDMIQDRGQLLDRPEVQVVIQMDGEGQGVLGNKEATWSRLTEGTEDEHWRWGWKNFFVRDHANGPYSPADTLDRTPVPVYITYQ